MNSAIPNLQLLNLPERLVQTVMRSFDKLLHSENLMKNGTMDPTGQATLAAKNELSEVSRRVAEGLVGQINSSSVGDPERKTLFSVALQEEVRRMCLEITRKGDPQLDLFSEATGTMPTFDKPIDNRGAGLGEIVYRVNKRFGIAIESSEVSTETSYNDLISMIKDRLPKE
ncbi:MAG: hypothetical protein HOA17_02725 [Candidatus Melainabacteria bacterium]|jgi:hypothetical protein|nr:hypothetical protein [Candidatus Melainabacteria bacterium]